MTALTEDRDTRRKDGRIGQGPVAASTKLYGGGMVCHNAAGYVVPGSDTAGLVLAGVCAGQQDNSAGANGDLTAEYERDGLHLMNFSGTATQANVGDSVCIVDDQTVALAAMTTNGIPAGKIAEFVVSNKVYVDIAPAVQ
jgi:hypothetical protein